MNHFKVALLQMMPTGSMEGNRLKGEAWCRTAKASGADLALFPEMWSIGYRIAEDTDELQKDAISREDGFVRFFADIARELDMAVGITFLEKVGGDRPKNTVIIFDRTGGCSLSYSKVHTYDQGDEIRLSRGNGFPVADLAIDGDTVRIGCMICYDREFPETARILMLEGAEVILVPNACPMEINRLSQLRARAYENMLGIATANYPLGNLNCTGHSSAFDGIVYPPGETVSRDTLLVMGGEREGIFIADFPLDEMREYRSIADQANTYRHPQLYGKLTEKDIRPPFIRDRYRE